MNSEMAELEYRSRQMMSNQIGLNDRNSLDWSAAKYPHEGLHVLNSKSYSERNTAMFCSPKNLAVTVPKIGNTVN